jgi:hypothetical protein
MKDMEIKIEGVEILGLEVQFSCAVDREEYDFGGVTLECEGREFIFDVFRTSISEDEDVIVCELEVDLDTFPKAKIKSEDYSGANLYNLTKEDFSNPNLTVKIFIEGDFEEEPDKIVLIILVDDEIVNINVEIE